MPVAEPAVFDAPVRRRHAPKHAYGLVTAWVFLGIILFAALAAPLVSPYSPTRQDLSVGGQLQGPSLTHLLGTDADGQDVLSRLIWGARPALEAGRGPPGAGGGRSPGGAPPPRSWPSPVSCSPLPSRAYWGRR